MTRYTVVWHPLAEDELVELWLKADDRGAVTVAIHRVDSVLASNPGEQGSAVSEMSRELTVEPVQVLFRVREGDRVVEIFSVAML